MRDVFKTGRASKPVRVPHVESLPCPQGGNHELINDELATLCQKCGVLWGDLDQEARKGKS